MDNKKKKIIVILSIALAVVIVAVIICLTVFGKDKGETSNNETSTHTSELTTEEPTTEEPATEEPAEIVTETESPTEAPTEAPTEEPTVPMNPEKPVVKDYTISWSNPYFFTKKFSDGTEKYYFTYMEEADIFGVETTAIGIIPESQYEYLEHSPDYYINGKTGSNPGSTREETTEQQTSGNTSNNQTEQEISNGNTPQLVTIDGQQYMLHADGTLIKLGGGTMTEEEWNEYLKWCEENGFTMTN